MLGLIALASPNTAVVLFVLFVFIVILASLLYIFRAPKAEEDYEAEVPYQENRIRDKFKLLEANENKLRTEEKVILSKAKSKFEKCYSDKNLFNVYLQYIIIENMLDNVHFSSGCVDNKTWGYYVILPDDLWRCVTANDLSETKEINSDNYETEEIQSF